MFFWVEKLENGAESDKFGPQHNIVELNIFQNGLHIGKFQLQVNDGNVPTKDWKVLAALKSNPRQCQPVNASDYFLYLCRKSQFCPTDFITDWQNDERNLWDAAKKVTSFRSLLSASGAKIKQTQFLSKDRKTKATGSTESVQESQWWDGGGGWFSGTISEEICGSFGWLGQEVLLQFNHQTWVGRILHQQNQWAALDHYAGWECQGQKCCSSNWKLFDQRHQGSGPCLQTFSDRSWWQQWWCWLCRFYIEEFSEFEDCKGIRSLQPCAQRWAFSLLTKDNMKPCLNVYWHLHDYLSFS